jgi:hypothetical protein
LTPAPHIGAPKNSGNNPKKDQEQLLRQVDPARPFRNDKSAARLSACRGLCSSPQG